MIEISVKEKYTVKSIDGFQCREWLLYKHYAKRIPLIQYAFGLFDNNNLLKGVVTYGTPSSSTLRGIFQHTYKVIELNRLCTNEGLERNTLSYFVSKSLKMLPKPLVVVSYADKAQCHHGYVYQSTNFIYTGLSAKRTDWKIKGLEHLHGATIADKSKGYENRAEYLKTKYGDDFYLVERSRKHRYFYLLGTKKEVKKMMAIFPYSIEPYPKGPNERYNASYIPQVQTTLF